MGLPFSTESQRLKNQLQKFVVKLMKASFKKILVKRDAKHQ